MALQGDGRQRLRQSQHSLMELGSGDFKVCSHEIQKDMFPTVRFPQSAHNLSYAACDVHDVT